MRMLLWGAVVLLCSCVDYAYDLSSKELSLDMKVEGNKVALPLGNLGAIVLDSFIDVDAMDMLEIVDGEYGISFSENMGAMTIELDPTVLSMDPIAQSTEVTFADLEFQDFVIQEMEHIVDCGITPVSTEGLADAMPQLQSSACMNIVTPEMEELMARLKTNPALEELTVEIDNTESPFVMDVEKVEFGINYVLPKEIKTISTVEIVGSVTNKGALVKFYINHPEAMSGMEKIVSFDVEFPESFVLEKDIHAMGADSYVLSADKHKLTVRNIVTKQDRTTIQFYIKELTRLDSYIEDGVLTMNEQIEYSVQYAMKGDMTFTTETDLDKFEFTVELDAQLETGEVSGVTNDIDVAFASMDFDFSGSFSGLQFVDEVEYFKFDPDKSKIRFVGDLNGGFDPFELTEYSQLKMVFPKNFVFDLSKSSYPKGTTYTETADGVAFVISDIESVDGFEWELAVSRINLNKKVVDCTIDLDGKVMLVAENDKLTLKGREVEELRSALEAMTSKETSFVFQKTELTVVDAAINTSYITADCKKIHPITIHSKIPDYIKRIESVSFVEDASIHMVMGINGLNSLDTKTIVDIEIEVELPSFLKIVCNDETVTMRTDGTLQVKKQYHPGDEDITLDLVCKGFDFTEDEFAMTNGLVPVKENGKTYIDYTTGVLVKITTGINETQVNTNLLDTPIDVDFNVTIDDMDVKTFSGEYTGDFETMNQSIAFNLGEQLAFLKNEGNTITLSEPQIELVMENTVGIPLNLEMQIVGKDDNGNVIDTACMEVEGLQVKAADYNEDTDELTPRKTYLLLTSDANRVAVEGFTNVEVPELATLLQRMPSSFEISLKPIIDNSVSHHVDISKILSFSGEYKVNIPFKFDTFDICLTDTIIGIKDALGTVLDMFGNVELAVNMDLENTIPVGLSLSTVALDADDKVLDGVTVEPIAVSAGKGGNIADGAKAEAVQLVLKGIAGQVTELDKLLFTIETSADHTEGGVALKPEQGIRISNIVLEVAGDIEMDLNKKQND